MHNSRNRVSTIDRCHQNKKQNELQLRTTEFLKLLSTTYLSLNKSFPLLEWTSFERVEEKRGLEKDTMACIKHHASSLSSLSLKFTA